MNVLSSTNRERELLELLCKRDYKALNLHVALVVAHPDDEAIGASNLLMRLQDIVIIYTTDGAPVDMEDAQRAGFASREEYKQARRRELHHALALAGIKPEQTRTLPFIDKEASLALVELTYHLARLFREGQFDVVISHPYEGGHPDHDATAFAARAACTLLERSGTPPPALIEMTSYHACEEGTRNGCFLLHDRSEEITVTLTPEERTLKQKMFAAHASQESVLRGFGIEHERFRFAPDYDFTQPPHAGQLCYETYGWGWTGERWRELARAALGELRSSGNDETLVCDFRSALVSHQG